MKNENSATVSVRGNLMHFSKVYRYEEVYDPQKQGTIYVLHIL